MLYTVQVFRQEIQPEKAAFSGMMKLDQNALRIHQCGVESVQLDHLN